MFSALLLIAVCFVAFTNGANANFKGVASLYGSGTTTLKQAACWGTFATFLGSITALFASQGLLLAFSGKGIVPDALIVSSEFVCAVALGAAFTSFLATRFGFPVSTTHALVGALVGAGLASGGQIYWNKVASSFLFPLFFSPFVAAFAGALFFLLLKAFKLLPDQRTKTLDVMHFASTGAASFARGLNDTPKMVALLLTVPGVNGDMGFILIAIMIALGGLLDIRRVAETLGKKITGMNAGEGFAASVVTAGLVATASMHSMPVSTTHVSVGSLLGMGIVTKQAKWRKVGEVFLAWISTLPCAGVLAAVAYLLLV